MSETEVVDTEEARLGAHQAALLQLEGFKHFSGTPSHADIEGNIALALTFASTRDWQEFHERASATLTGVIDALNICLVNARHRETEERLARVREAEKKSKQREIEALAFAEAARKATEALDREDAAERKRDAERKEEAERAAAAAQAIRRLAEERAEATRIKWHGDALRDIVWYGRNCTAHATPEFLLSRQKQASDLYQGRDWEEFAERARAAADEAHQNLEAAIVQSRAREAAELVAAQEAARDRAQQELDAKIAAEKLEDERRAANVTHRKAAHRSAIAKIICILDDLDEHEQASGEGQARAIVEAIAKGAVPHLVIRY